MSYPTELPVLFIAMVFKIYAVPLLYIPPELLDAEHPLIVELTIVTVPVSLQTPPPYPSPSRPSPPSAEHPLNVEFLIAAKPLL
jgi:hypothetical protein